MLLELINKHLHIMFGTTFLGLIIANYFYIAYSAHSQQVALLRYALKTSFWIDLAILLIINFLFMSAELLVKQNHLSIQVSWIRAAYFALSLVSLLWILVFAIKLKSYKLLDVNNPRLAFTKFFHAFNIAIIILTIIIIHDAVTQSTFLILS